MFTQGATIPFGNCTWGSNRITALTSCGKSVSDTPVNRLVILEKSGNAPFQSMTRYRLNTVWSPRNTSRFCIVPRLGTRSAVGTTEGHPDGRNRTRTPGLGVYGLELLHAIRARRHSLRYAIRNRVPDSFHKRVSRPANTIHGPRSNPSSLTRRDTIRFNS